MALSLHAPEHRETLRWSAVLYMAEGQVDRAAEALRRALVHSPDDPELHRMLAAALFGRIEAYEALQAAAACTTRTDDWLALGIAFDKQGYMSEALGAAERCLEGDPGAASARLLRARCLQALGRILEAADEYRGLIARRQSVAQAWFGMLDLKTQPLHDEELAALEREVQRATGFEERSLLDFALGSAYEAAGRYESAFSAFEQANRRVSVRRAWDPGAFSAQVTALASAFEGPLGQGDAAQGSEVVFLVGLPRSGSTLFEQILSAHSRVEGASELAYLDHVIARESHRRQKSLAQWAPEARQEDWSRLGRDYLTLTARWRQHAPISTDKLPSNWLLVGAIRAMLPSARIVDCRRDPVETCWSCFKQLFAPGKADYSHDLVHLAAYWRDYERLARLWAVRHPDRYREFRYEDLVTDLEGQARALLDYCGLPFESACLRPHEVERSVRTASSAQVRQPVRRSAGYAERYGALLDPLRDLLGVRSRGPAGG